MRLEHRSIGQGRHRGPYRATRDRKSDFRCRTAYRPVCAHRPSKGFGMPERLSALFEELEYPCRNYTHFRINSAAPNSLTSEIPGHWKTSRRFQTAEVEVLTEGPFGGVPCSIQPYSSLSLSLLAFKCWRSTKCGSGNEKPGRNLCKETVARSLGCGSGRTNRDERCNALNKLAYGRCHDDQGSVIVP